uniref:CCHC-type domain-containing protein n=1 Tax=Nothobranchius furzeri TaxID=105023 RepID=A0A8C6KAW0_NOTFU
MAHSRLDTLDYLPVVSQRRHPWLFHLQHPTFAPLDPNPPSLSTSSAPSPPVDTPHPGLFPPHEPASTLNRKSTPTQIILILYMSWVNRLNPTMTESSSQSSNLSTESASSVVSATLSQHSNSLQTLSDQLFHTDHTLFELGTMVKELSNRLTSPEQASSPAPSLPGPVLPTPSDLPSFRVATSPPPETFDGDREVCRGFLLQCQLAFPRSPESFSTEEARISYIIGLLRSKALRWAEAKSRNPSFLNCSLDEFLADFKTTFDKPESAAEVARQIWSLRQGRLSIADFAIEFRTLATTSTLDEASLKGAFTQALNEQLQDQLAFCQEPPDLESLIALCIRTARKRGNNFPLPSRLNLPPNVTSAAPAPLSSEPMQIGRAKLTQEERNKRMSSGACLYCGMSGHFVANCPKQLNSRTHQLGQMKIGSIQTGPSLTDCPADKLLLSITLHLVSGTATLKALLDSGASDHFMDRDLPFPICHCTPPFHMSLGNHRESIRFLLVSASSTPRLLGWGPNCSFQQPLPYTPPTTLSTSVSDTIPPPYRDLAVAFDKGHAGLLPDTTPPRGRIFSLSPVKSRAMDEHITEALGHRIIHPSTSPGAAGFFFVKKNGGLYLCIDYHVLNQITIKDLFPLMNKALDCLAQSAFFTKLSQMIRRPSRRQPTVSTYPFCWPEALAWGHSSIWSGHPGARRKLQFLRRPLWWLTMAKDVKDYTAACKTCTCNKTSNQNPATPQWCVRPRLLHFTLKIRSC